ncbi:MAG: inorganic phosphate transporter, partial [Alistipes sp.]|nr:inorganic phosphate transporter [Alistipes sp.]
NILRITILSGVFALALAFAGNDLVNFIGVPVASFDAYNIARQAGDTSLTMGALAENVPANMPILLSAGIIMICTLWASKKAIVRVTKTELSLTSQGGDDGQEQYGSSLFSRTIVRAALNVNAGIERVVPLRVREAIARRFEYEDVEHSGAPYDMIRATVNLTTSALLIAVATSLKLPLSTTYVCFMVAMGSSLADKAWGRESAVYRISGVMTVVAGWFVTAFGGFLISFLVGLVLIYGGTATFVVVTILCGWIMFRSRFSKKHKDEEETPAQQAPATTVDIIAALREEVCRTMECATKIYDRTMIAVMKENRKVLRDMVKEANDLFYQSRERKYTLLPTLKKLQSGDVTTAHYYVQVVDYLNEMTKALLHITRPAFEHIDNSHEGLSAEQARDLMAINDDVEAIYRRINRMLGEGDFSEIEAVLTMRDQLFEAIAEAIKSELTRVNEARSSTKASILYLAILTETKNMVLQSRNLLKSQQYFLKHRQETKKWF